MDVRTCTDLPACICIHAYVCTRTYIERVRARELNILYVRGAVAIKWHACSCTCTYVAKIWQLHTIYYYLVCCRPSCTYGISRCPL